MCEYPQQHFANAAFVAGGMQGVSEKSFELRKCALNLPALAEHFFRKIVLHLEAVMTVFHRTFKAARIDGNGRAGNSQLLAAKHMKRFAVVSTIRRQRLQRQMRDGVLYGLAEMTGIVARPKSNHGRGDQVGLMLADDSQLDPAPMPFQPAAFFQKVATDIMALKSGGIHGSGWLVGEQSVFCGVFKNSCQEAVKGPFFSSLFSAFWSVVK